MAAGIPNFSAVFQGSQGTGGSFFEELSRNQEQSRRRRIEALRMQQAEQQAEQQRTQQAADMVFRLMESSGGKLDAQKAISAVESLTNARVPTAILPLADAVAKSQKEQEKQRQFQEQLPSAAQTLAAANLNPNDPKLQAELVRLNDQFDPDQLRRIQSEGASRSSAIREERQFKRTEERRKDKRSLRQLERELRLKSRLARELEDTNPAEAARQRFEIESKLNDDVVKQSDPFLTVSDAHDKIVGVLQNPDSPAAMQAAIIAFNKVLDPESVVRESEFGRTFSFQSLENRFRSFIERQQEGTVNEEVLRDLLEATDRLALAAARTQRKREKQFSRRARELDVNVDNVLPAQRADSLIGGIKDRGVGRLPARNVRNPRTGSQSSGPVEPGQTVRLPSGTLTLER